MVTEISDWNDLDNVRNDRDEDYILVNDLNKSTAGYDSVASENANSGDGWEPLWGEFATGYFGEFDGNGYTISDIYVDRPDIQRCGLFGSNQGGTVKNLGLFNVDITGGDESGPLIGNSEGPVSNCFATGYINAGESSGGFIGVSRGGIENSYAIVDVDLSGNFTGGFVGSIDDNPIQNSYYAGEVISGNTAFCGNNRDTITDCYFDEEVATTSLTDGGTALTTSEMTGSSADTNMSGFDFTNDWSTTVPTTISTETITGQITLDENSVNEATVIVHNSDEPTTIAEPDEDGYPTLLDFNKTSQLESQGVTLNELPNNNRTQTDTNGDYSVEIPGSGGDTVVVGVDYDDGTDTYGRVITTVL